MLNHKEEILELEEISIDSLIESQLIVYNDDVNTFDDVIDALVAVCEHTPEQAEQCTLIIHYKGKCTVKMGKYEDLVPMRNAICERGISAEVVK